MEFSTAQASPSSQAADLGRDDPIKQQQQQQQQQQQRCHGSAPHELKKSRSHKVLGACAPCKRAHLACEPSRPCKRCVAMGREEQCIDLPQKKRGRPKLSASTAQQSKISRTTPLIISSNGHRDQGGPLSAPAFSSSYSRTAGEIRSSPSHTAVFPAPIFSSSAPVSQGQGLFPANYSLAAAPTQLPQAARPRPMSMILITTTDFFLLRASDSSVEILGKPSTTLQRSWMSELLPSEDLLALFPLCQWLISPPGVHLSTDQAAEVAVDSATWPEITQAAEGSPFPEREVRMHKADGSLIAVNMRMHLGRGAGLDFHRPETFSKAYIVISCFVTQTSPALAPLPVVPLPRPKSASNAAPEPQTLRNRPSFADLLSSTSTLSHPFSVPQPPPPQHQLRAMPSLPSISALTQEVDNAHQSQAASISSPSTNDLPTFCNPFASAQAPPSTSEPFRFQNPQRPQTTEAYDRPRSIVLPPPTMLGFGAHATVRSPGIYGHQHRPMSTESHLSISSAYDGAGGSSGHRSLGPPLGAKDLHLPSFASFAARGSIASIESGVSAAPSDGLWSPSLTDEQAYARGRGGALRTGTGDSSAGVAAMDGLVLEPLEPPSFPFPHHHQPHHTLFRPGSRQ